MQVVVSSLPANQDCLDDYSKAQPEDRVCSKLIEYCTKGWLAQNELSIELKDYWKYRGELTVVSNLLLYHSRIVIPTDLRQRTLEKIHQWHQGVQKCRMRVLLLSGGLEYNKQLKILCSHAQSVRKLLWYLEKQIAFDLLELKGSTYLLVVDYSSRFMEVLYCVSQEPEQDD